MKPTRRRLLALLATLVVTSGGMLVTSGTASAEYDVRIVSARSGMCLNLAQWDTNDGATIIQWPCNYNERRNNEKWNLISRYPDSGPHSVTSEHSGKCLDITGTRNGDRVTQKGCYYNNNGHQGWFRKHQGNSDGWNYFTFENVHADKCLDVPNGTTNGGAVIQLWDCNGTQAQLWRIPVE